MTAHEAFYFALGALTLAVIYLLITKPAGPDDHQGDDPNDIYDGK